MVVMVLFIPVIALAHGGRTDSAGGHTDRDTGEYHYHHGHEAHQHPNGECPFDYDNQMDSQSTEDSKSLLEEYNGYKVATKYYYDDGYDEGYDVGYDKGFKVGQDHGYDLGHSDGFAYGKKYVPKWVWWVFAASAIIILVFIGSISQKNDEIKILSRSLQEANRKIDYMTKR